MKEGIHPDYHEIKIVMNDGTEFMTRSCWGKAGEVMKLDVDPTTHMAWNPEAGQKIGKDSQAAKFMKKFAGLESMTSKKKTG